MVCSGVIVWSGLSYYFSSLIAIIGPHLEQIYKAPCARFQQSSTSPLQVCQWIFFLLIHQTISYLHLLSVFDAGENLSCKGCGLWNNGYHEFAPWSVSIVRSDGRADCPAILVSPTTIISGKYCVTIFLTMILIIKKIAVVCQTVFNLICA